MWGSQKLKLGYNLGEDGPAKTTLSRKTWWQLSLMIVENVLSFQIQKWSFFLKKFFHGIRGNLINRRTKDKSVYRELSGNSGVEGTKLLLIRWSVVQLLWSLVYIGWKC